MNTDPTACPGCGCLGSDCFCPTLLAEPELVVVDDDDWVALDAAAMYDVLREIAGPASRL